MNADRPNSTMRYLNKALIASFFSAYLLFSINSNNGTSRNTSNRLGDSGDDKKKSTLDSIVTSEGFMSTRILIDPGHGPYDGITKVYGTRKDFSGKNNLNEFDMTYKISEYLKQALENDPRFDVQMTKNLHDYEQDFKDFCNSNMTDINRLYPIGKIVFNDGKEYNIDSLKSVNKKDPVRTKDDWKKLYAIFLYSQEFDIYISPHLDYSGRKKINGRKLTDGEYVDSGYTIIINPHNKKFEETKELAETLSEELSKIQDITTTKIMNSRYSNKKIKSQIKSLNEKGVALRNLASLGSGTNPGNNIALLIEYGHLKNVDTTYAFVKSIVDATVRSIYLSKDMPIPEEVAKR